MLFAFRGWNFNNFDCVMALGISLFLLGLLKSNGLVERAVLTFKLGLKKQCGGSVDTKVASLCFIISLLSIL